MKRCRYNNPVHQIVKTEQFPAISFLLYVTKLKRYGKIAMGLPERSEGGPHGPERSEGYTMRAERSSVHLRSMVQYLHVCVIF